MGEPIRIERPTVLPVSLTDLKDQAHIDGSAEDHLLISYLYAAVEEVERRACLSLITQTWEQRFAMFQDEMILRMKPVQSVASIAYLDADDALQTLDSSVYRVAGIGFDKSYATVRRASGQTWPVTRDDAEAVRVTFQTGYGDSGRDVPESLRHYVLVIAATSVKFREEAETSAVREVPWPIKERLRDWRPLAVA